MLVLRWTGHVDLNKLQPNRMRFRTETATMRQLPTEAGRPLYGSRFVILPCKTSSEGSNWGTAIND